MIHFNLKITTVAATLGFSDLLFHVVKMGLYISETKRFQVGVKVTFLDQFKISLK